jgi:hypothetical protein
MLLLPQRFSRGRPPRSFDDLDEPAGAREDVLHLPAARVVLADYRALRHDFADLRHLSETRIDEWLVANAAWISHAQARQAVVNSPIAVGARVASAFRPPHYGRAVVAQVPDGLVDLKGAGVRPGRTPSHDQHANGLEYLGVAIGDFLLKSAIDQIFARAAWELWTVPVYAIFDLGFDITDGWHGTAPAGMHVRRAHRRPPGGMPLPATGSREQMAQFQVEMTLRSYGLTSATMANAFDVVHTNGRLEAYDGGEPVADLTDVDEAFFRSITRGADTVRFERVNVQLIRRASGSRAGEVLDFGNYHVRPSFDHPVSSAVSDRPFCLGPVLWPDDPDYIQPDPRLHVPASVWHRPELNERCFPLAENFRAGRCSRERLIEELEMPLRALVEQWSNAHASNACGPRSSMA